METIRTTTNRIHPLMAAAAVSVIVVSLAGTAAITGVLPSSHSEPAPQASSQMMPAAPAMAPANYVQPVQPAPQPAPVSKAAPQTKTVHVHHHPAANRVASRGEEPRYTPQPAPAPQPNYVGIGTGAVIGGLIGNQIGGGNGKTLATVAGVIGGGMIGNEIANRNR